MKVELDMHLAHWWIEKAEPYKQPEIKCRAFVKLTTLEEDDKKRITIEKEETFKTPEEAIAWIKGQS